MAVLRGGVLVFKEEAFGIINGANKTFTTSFKFVDASLQVQLNGLELFVDNDFNILTDQSFEFVDAPTGGADSDRVTVVYQRL